IKNRKNQKARHPRKTTQRKLGPCLFTPFTRILDAFALSCWCLVLDVSLDAWYFSRLAFKNHHDRVIGQNFLRANVDMGVGQGRDADDVLFAGFLEEIGDELVKFIMADFDAVRVADGFHPHFLVAGLGGGSKGTSGLAMRLSDVLRTGTLRCKLTLAA